MKEPNNINHAFIPPSGHNVVVTATPAVGAPPNAVLAFVTCSPQTELEKKLPCPSKLDSQTF